MAQLALHYPAPAEAPTLVHFHGNAEQLADRTPLFERLHALGLGVLVVEYPGYGKATGEPSEESFYEAAEAALAHLRGIGVPASKSVLQGQSIGSGVAAEMALRGHGARLVLLTPYTSMPEMARLVTSFLPGRLLVRHRFDTLAKAGRVEVPVLIIHGTEDEAVPFEMGERLSTAFPRAVFHAVEGGMHDVFAGRAHALASQIFVFATKQMPVEREGR